MQMTTHQEVRDNFLLEHGPVAEMHRAWLHMHLRAAADVAFALDDDTWPQYHCVASHLEGSEAVVAGAKVGPGLCCISSSLKPPSPHCIIAHSDVATRRPSSALIVSFIQHEVRCTCFLGFQPTVHASTATAWAACCRAVLSSSSCC